eukprot:CAMPEP_0115662584 /NCGR_PEP_ID=MMETSP0272-20121206/47395_1 /TAXON_ID=71861 /ORGANISM="Scrippsiella trochoidea, Strain CCMP3099" /LENGTH=108 /DNA_ID=CAMNT_0003100895 /DNA_START=81 /DNA_END=404 /DNA_ORIENTATION=-
MSYWLWWSVPVGLLYLLASIVLGDDDVWQVFDVRMDHCAKTAESVNPPALIQQITAMAQQEKSMLESLRVIKVIGRMVEIPRAGFVLWHAIWSFLFLVILGADKFKHS